MRYISLNLRMIKWRRESALDLYILLLSVFLFISPWLFARASETTTVDLLARGAAIAALSLAALIAFAIWEEWANLLLGIWLIVSPWVLGFAHTSAMHRSIAVGPRFQVLPPIVKENLAGHHTMPRGLQPSIP